MMARVSLIFCSQTGKKEESTMGPSDLLRVGNHWKHAFRLFTVIGANLLDRQRSIYPLFKLSWVFKYIRFADWSIYFLTTYYSLQIDQLIMLIVVWLIVCALASNERYQWWPVIIHLLTNMAINNPVHQVKADKTNRKHNARVLVDGARC